MCLGPLITRAGRATREKLKTSKVRKVKFGICQTQNSCSCVCACSLDVSRPFLPRPEMTLVQLAYCHECSLTLVFFPARDLTKCIIPAGRASGTWAQGGLVVNQHFLSDKDKLVASVAAATARIAAAGTSSCLRPRGRQLAHGHRRRAPCRA